MNTTEITNFTMQNWLMFAMIGWAIAGALMTLVQIAKDRIGGSNGFLWWFLKFLSVNVAASVMLMTAGAVGLMDAATYTIGGMIFTGLLNFFPVFPTKKLAAKFVAIKKAMS